MYTILHFVVPVHPMFDNAGNKIQILLYWKMDIWILSWLNKNYVELKVNLKLEIFRLV